MWAKQKHNASHRLIIAVGRKNNFMFGGPAHTGAFILFDYSLLLILLLYHRLQNTIIL